MPGDALRSSRGSKAGKQQEIEGEKSAKRSVQTRRLRVKNISTLTPFTDLPIRINVFAVRRMFQLLWWYGRHAETHSASAKQRPRSSSQKAHGPEMEPQLQGGARNFQRSKGSRKDPPTKKQKKPAKDLRCTKCLCIPLDSASREKPRHGIAVTEASILPSGY